MLVAAGAADIEGVVLVRHKLTKKRVTLAAGAYDRGVAVGLRTEAAEDPLVFERKHVAIYLDEAGTPSGSTAVAMEQKDRRFVPDLLVAPVGSVVSFPNLDPFFHNVFSLSKAKSFDLGNYANGQTRTIRLSKPGLILVNCRLHSNMAAAILVTPNSWNTVADAQGCFRLKDVPAGKHTVVAWHKTAGFFRTTIVLNEGRNSTVSFDIPLDEEGNPLAGLQRAGR